MIPLTDRKNKFYEEQEVYHICTKEFCYDKNEKNKSNYIKKLQREIPVIIHNGLV